MTLSIRFGFSYTRALSPTTAVPPLAASTLSPSLALLANNLSVPTSDLPPGASPRKKPRKQQHVISTEEGDMMETNSTDDERSAAKSLLVKAEKRKSPPKEYIGNAVADCCHAGFPTQVGLGPRLAAWAVSRVAHSPHCALRVVAEAQ